MAVYIMGSVAVMGLVPPDQLTQSNAPFSDAAAFLWGEHARDPLGHSDIGRGLVPFAVTARTDFVDDGREIGLLWLQPHLSQSVGNDGFHAGRYPRTPRAIRPRKKRRDTAVLPIPGELI